MAEYFITGGRQRAAHLRTRDEWHAYGKAVLLHLDTDTGVARCVLEYESPEGRRPVRDPSFVFKAGSWDGDHLLLCTQTEVVIFDPRAGSVARTVSHPWLNDVHHVERIDGRLHVVSTGLDALLVFDEADEQVVEVHSATGADPWAQRSRDVDYRLLATTKPHQAHPNYVYRHHGQRWISRFEQRDTLRIDGEPLSLRLSDDPVHDGVVVGEDVWFTAVSGQVIVARPDEQQVVARYDLNAMESGPARPLGWCRGIRVEGSRSGHRTLLGFSRLRPTTLKQNLAWLRRPLGRQPEPHPTRVAAYDLAAGEKLETWPLEQTGISSIFSILPARPDAGPTDR